MHGAETDINVFSAKRPFPGHENAWDGSCKGHVFMQEAYHGSFICVRETVRWVLWFEQRKRPTGHQAGRWIHHIPSFLSSSSPPWPTISLE
ncbi:hypothetical protein AVEN_1417-1 [Araneus ventricosus]|uniref:Uncharacterized protein n=1 Tax=Araneus ventricosus TaxID=182803 RepID=A0A4Y2SW75_ARAVE|nr:hypothetical protein AVEN_1417-1 [Araneus ventricosus]